MRSSPSFACSFESQVDGTCTDSGVDDESVSVSATIDTPSTGGADPSENWESGIGLEAPAIVIDSVGESWCDLQRLPCVPWTPPVDAATGPVSISDIATFRPQAPAAGMQPNQWMIVGLDTNFYATASTHIVDGTLFGGTAQVRFTPVSYRWDYGDGNTATLSSPGTTWAKYKIAEFDPTPTSHTYDNAGNYTITLAVTYAAEYRVAGSSWRSVIGTLTIVAPPLNATAGHATTVLVDQDCNTNPTGIGC
ncbi:MAG: PKD domain-containing protein [Rhodoglobus sp.]